MGRELKCERQNIWTSVFIASLFRPAENWKQNAIDWRTEINKSWYSHGSKWRGSNSNEKEWTLLVSLVGSQKQSHGSVYRLNSIYVKIKKQSGVNSVFFRHMSPYVLKIRQVKMGGISIKLRKGITSEDGGSIWSKRGAHEPWRRIGVLCFLSSIVEMLEC